MTNSTGARASRRRAPASSPKAPTDRPRRSGRTRLVGVALAAAALLVAAVGCGDDSGGEARGIKLVESGKLTVCAHLPPKPFEFKDKKGKVVGFNVDLMERFADDLGVPTDYVNVNDWNQVTSGAVYSANRCDVGMGGMTITPERQKALTISDPYFDATQALLVRKDSPYKGLADLKGKKIGVMIASTGQKYAEERTGKYGYTPVKYTDLALELNGFTAGNVDAVLHDNGPLYDYVNSHPDSHVVAEFDTGEQYGFSAKKNDANAEKLIERLNTVLKKTRDDGSYDEIYRKWFKTAPKA